MIKHTWEAVGDLWHPGMKNMAGPWDRSYGYDMNRYLSLMALWFWSLAGKENSSLIQRVGTILTTILIQANVMPSARDHVAHGRLRLGTSFRRTNQEPPEVDP
jgi:hypothetical protein